ncbi:hypothetical protein [Nitrosomonas ureae]|uniref:Uncharacterized protein n=1 Tax=Nitrosomonas ureae TaxID=44577 RepID=A0A1H2GCV8_9PROT|nr:hypothetical protein [Nitrosomonas ureae]ALQ51724.1 hypothetical protein ATY38_11115 [Nitrosomonas ureae]SDU17400.1 hypothetical protein SAMN05216406_13033 [Nitrosomonas ureae]
MAWRVADSLKILREQINQIAPNRSVSSDGTIGDAAHASRKSDHNPWIVENGIGVVTALDVTHDPMHGCDAQRLVDSLVSSKDSRVKYIIYNRKIISSTFKPWEWRPYEGVNPHIKHCHISVNGEKEKYDSALPWQINLT